MEVSVIIVNYNTYQLTTQCIASVIEKTKGVDYEIILVDNASVECDPILFKEKFPNIILIQSKTNLGFAGGNNLGIQQASGKNILLLNSDTLLVENSISFIVNKCAAIPNFGVASVKLMFPDGRVQPAAKPFPSVFAHFLKATRLRVFCKDLYRRLTVYDYDKSFRCDWVWGTFFYFPAKNLQYTKGKLPETYFMYSEDVEWCYAFKKHGLHNYYFSESAIVHYGGQSSTSVFKNKLMLQNHLHFIRYNYGFIPWCIERLLFWIDDIEERIRFGKK